MKNFLTPVLALLALSLFMTPGRTQTIVTYDQTLIGGTMPGSANDFIFFWSGDYPFGGPADDHNIGPGGNTFSNLNSFTINGGVQGQNTTPPGFAIITTPLGQSVTTGAIVAGPGIAFALTPTPGTAVPGFNYNDFNLFLMISNTNGVYTDKQVSVDPRNTVQNPAFGTDDVNVTDNITGTGAAEYLEFNVQGLGDSMAAHPGADLVISANLPSPMGQFGYIGALSVESVPEPSTYAMLLIGLALLGCGLRRRNAQVALAREV